MTILSSKHGFLHILVRGVLLALFVCTFYSIHNFEFGVRDNLEELPLLYQKLDKAEYLGDVYIEEHTQHFVPVTPYILLLTSLAKMLPFLDLSRIFLILHIVLIISIYIAIRSLLTPNTIQDELLVTLCALCLFVIEAHRDVFLPNNRGIFMYILDPTFVSGISVLVSLVYFINNKYKLFFVTFLFAAAMHVAYPLLATPGFLGVALYRFHAREISTKNVSVLGLALLVLCGYCFFLWQISRQTITNSLHAYDIFLFHHPQYNHLAKLFTEWNLVASYFTSVGIALLTCVVLVFSSRSNFSISHKRIIELCVFALGLLLIQLITSAIQELWQVNEIILLKPYSTSAIVISVTWIALWSAILQLRKLLNPKVRLAMVTIFIMCIGWNIITLVDIAPSSAIQQTDAHEVILWISKHTEPSDLFLNYTKKYGLYSANTLDIRTQALRPVYFNLSTIPLTADAQLGWYERFLLQWNLSPDLHPTDVQPALENHMVDLQTVLTKIETPVSYVLLPTGSTEFVVESMHIVFQNSTYTILSK